MKHITFKQHIARLVMEVDDPALSAEWQSVKLSDDMSDLVEFKHRVELKRHEKREEESQSQGQ